MELEANLFNVLISFKPLALSELNEIRNIFFSCTAWKNYRAPTLEPFSASCLEMIYKIDFYYFRRLKLLSFHRDDENLFRARSFIFSRETNWELCITCDNNLFYFFLQCLRNPFGALTVESQVISSGDENRQKWSLDARLKFWSSWKIRLRTRISFWWTATFKRSRMKRFPIHLSYARRASVQLLLQFCYPGS